MKKIFKKTYAIDAETITTGMIKLGDIERMQVDKHAFQIKAIDADVDVKLYVGCDVNDAAAYAEKTLTNTTVKLGETNIYEMPNSAVAWANIELTSAGTTDVVVVINGIVAGVV